ncbi:MAG: TolC family protein [Vicinamibacterales bacterium]
MSRFLGAAAGVAVGLVVGLAAAPVAAQTAAPPEAVTFEAAVQRALTANLTVERASTAVLGAEALLAQARAAVLPTAGGSAVVTVLDDARGFSGNVVQPRTQLTLSGSVDVPVLAASRWAARAQAADQVALAKLTVADIRRQVGVAAAQAYLAVVTGKRQLEVNERARDTARAQLEYATARREGGVGSRLNEARAAQELAVTEELVERTRLAVALGQEALGRLLAADHPVDAADTPALAAPAADGDAWWLARTDITLFDARVAAQARVVADSRRDWIPTIGASFQPQYLTPSGLFQPSGTWRALLSATIPLYDSGQRKATRARREADLALFRVDRQDAELGAKSEVRIARATIDAEMRALGRAREAATHAAEVLRITDVAFRAGATTNIELVDAQRRARDAESAVALAEDRARLARLALLVALGRFPA